MDNIKNQFQNLRKNTPKHIQWILLVVAFVVVGVLLVLIVRYLTNRKSVVPTSDIQTNLIIDKEIVECSDIVIAGDPCNQTINVKATNPASILSVSLEKSDIDGLVMSEYCSSKNIDSENSCGIRIIYKPNNATETPVKTNMNIKWIVSGDDEQFSVLNTIPITLSAVKNTAIEEDIITIGGESVITEPDVFTTEPETEIPVENDTDTELNVDDTKQVIAEQPIAVPVKTKPIKKKKKTETCSDYAIPGYDSMGNAIGWIKPRGGIYEFHPFSDTECNNPTGIYNPNTGVITDIQNNAKKIGTDAEHIGYTGGATADNISLPESFSTSTTSRSNAGTSSTRGNGFARKIERKTDAKKYIGTGEAESVYSSMPYDRTFILRQFKPIPATIVSEVRADPSIYEEGGKGIPIRATVDRNVYSDNGRTIILPTGTLLMGYLKGKLPGPYSSVGRMQINWYQFIRPDGVEFNFSSENQDPYSADSQGRVGVPGYGSTDYVEQIVMPLLTAIVPAAVNMIAPIADKFVNQIDLDNNTVVQSGTVRSSELAKNEVITAWNQVAQKLMVDALDNTVPPFSIAAGTRITVYSPVDLVATCGTEENKGKPCAFHEYGSEKRRSWSELEKPTVDYTDPSWVGQVRSFNIKECCDMNSQDKVNQTKLNNEPCSNYDYRTLVIYCQSQQYDAINTAKQKALYTNQQDSNNKNSVASMGVGSQQYNEQILGMKYNEETGAYENPFEHTSSGGNATATQENVLTCDDGTLPNSDGCCTGETLTDMGGGEMACCPDTGGDCFPPFD